MAAVIERGEKQILLARHARRLLHYIDDTPIVPGDQREGYEHADASKNVIEEAENDLRSWQRSDEPIPTSAGEITDNLLPASANKPQSENPDKVEGTDGTDGTETVRISETITVNGVQASKPEHPQASGAIGTQPIAVPY